MIRAALPVASLFFAITAGPCCGIAAAPPPQSVQQDRAELESLEIRNVKLYAWQGIGEKRKYLEVQEFREIREQHLIPADKFDVRCEVVGGSDLRWGDFSLWTKVDFLVAPVTRAYEQMDNNELGSSVSWGQVTEMRDLFAVPIYHLRAGEKRRIVVKDLDLGTVLTAFPTGDAGELWPWLIRVSVHVQDRSGKQVAISERTLRLSPSSARKTSRYDDPILKESP